MSCRISVSTGVGVSRIAPLHTTNLSVFADYPLPGRAGVNLLAVLDYVYRAVGLHLGTPRFAFRLNT